jgi:FtsH-binding integral membrane protein
MKDGIGLWLTAGIFVILFGCWFVKIKPFLGIGIFVVCSIASLFLFFWAAERDERKSSAGSAQTGSKSLDKNIR